MTTKSVLMRPPRPATQGVCPQLPPLLRHCTVDWLKTTALSIWWLNRPKRRRRSD